MRLQLCFVLILAIGCLSGPADRFAQDRTEFGKYTFVQRAALALLKPGYTTEAASTALLGADFFLRHTFEPPFPYPKDGQTQPVDLIITYLGTESQAREEPAVLRSTINLRRRTLTLFFYQDKLLWHSLLSVYYDGPDRIVRLDPETTADVLPVWQKEPYPYAKCALKYYSAIVRRRPPPQIQYKTERCFWEASDKKVN
jgi:hypothetical protein